MRHGLHLIFVVFIPVIIGAPFTLIMSPSHESERLFHQTSLCNPDNLLQVESQFQQLTQIRTEQPDVFSEEAYRIAALNYIGATERCRQGNRLPDEQKMDNEAIKIDDGGLWYTEFGLVSEETVKAQYVIAPTKWPKDSEPGTSGGLVTYSFMKDGVDHSAEAIANPKNILVTTLVQNCDVKREITTAFAAWSAVADIQFVEVTDNGLPSNDRGATGDIRIGAHQFFDSSRLAHGFFPPGNGGSIAGDIHFNARLAKPWAWSCDGRPGTFDIGLVALHEIGHVIGLDHEPLPPPLEDGKLAVMNRGYNALIELLQADDKDGATNLYGYAGGGKITGGVGCSAPVYTATHEVEPFWESSFNNELKLNRWVLTQTVATQNNSWFVPNQPILDVSQAYLTSPPITATTSFHILTFLHKYSFQHDFSGFYDGGVVEIQVNNQAWTHIDRNLFIKNSYNGLVAKDFENPLAEQWAFAGSSGDGDPDNNNYIESAISLSSHLVTNDTFRIRFRFDTDNYDVGNPGEGWYVDDVTLCERMPYYFPYMVGQH
ncbi:MAG: matrixin family metalloprotease [Anaerolineaceae bacterium]|nr:matrixin family metalloprotease [Anaerolineaceae bacterium]MCB9102001.1 matrixin family metalloprotease [Anaerolineales bacterium]